MGDEIRFAEFDDVDFLTNSEVAVVLQQLRSANPEKPFSECVVKCSQKAEFLRSSHLSLPPFLPQSISPRIGIFNSEFIDHLPRLSPIVSHTTFVLPEQRHGGVGAGGGPQAAQYFDEMRAALKSLEFHRVEEDGSTSMEHLHDFESAALCNLNPHSVEMAKALIPSLERFEDMDVQRALDEINRAAARMLME